MPKRRFSLGESTYFCHACHKETRDTGRGEAGTGLCWLCYQINEIENLHLDEDHEPEFQHCLKCHINIGHAGLLDHLPYYLGEKSFPTI